MVSVTLQLSIMASRIEARLVPREAGSPPSLVLGQKPTFILDMGRNGAPGKAGD